MSDLKIILILLFSFLVIAAGMIWNLSQLQSSLIQSTALRTAQLYSVSLAQFRTLYTSQVVAKAKAMGVEVSHDFLSRDDVLPLPVTFSMQLAEEIGKHVSGASASLYSPYPFSWREKERKHEADSFETDAWSYLLAHPGESYSRFEQTPAGRVLRYATADVMQPDCVACHNSHADTPKNDWQVGDVRGVLSISLPLNDIVSQTNSELRSTSLEHIVIGFFVVSIIGIVIINLRKQAERLKRHVAVRTADLRAEKQTAEKASQAKSEFLSRMSHELRTPMNAILGFGQMLELDSKGLSKTQRGNVGEILGAGHHLLMLINDVLDLSIIESGKLNLSVGEVSVDAVIRQSISLIQPLAEARQLELVVHASDEACLVQADEMRLKQVLVNLLSNAVKYNRDNGRIIISSNLVQGGRLRISVTDSGEGLSAEDVEKLFTPFERLGKADNVEGVGIGLVISKHLIELMNGSIGVSSAPGKGSTFWVELALLKNEDRREYE